MLPNRFLLPSLAMILVAAAGALAQDDPSRELPSRIGEPTCSNVQLGRDATLQGSLTVRGPGVTNDLKLEVAVTGSGLSVGRKRLKNGNSFTFYCIPKENVMLAIYIDGQEFQTISLGNLLAPPQINRQDFVVTYSQSTPSQPKPDVVSAEALYKRSPANAKLFSEAIARSGEGDASKAAKLLRQLVASDPDDYIAWTQLGNFDLNAGHPEVAEGEYRSAIKVSQTFLPALLGLGRSNLALKHTDAAIQTLEEAVKQDNSSADAHHYLGEAYLQAKKGSLAIPQLRTAIELEPVKKASLHLRIAALYHAAGAKQLAVEECRQYLLAVPNAADRANVEKYIADNSKDN